MPRGANAKREREYEELKGRFRREHRYPGREEEVASRIVNKQRAQHGETKEARHMDRQGGSPDRGLPLKEYEHLTVPQVVGRLKDLAPGEIRKILDFERRHLQRKTLVQRLERALKATH